jgi:CPA2 family monovalent cation:H+ antiporter-2
MQSLPPLIIDLAIMLGIASMVTLFFQRIGQPVVLGYLVAGLIIGPYTPPTVLINDISNIKILSELGVIFLIFSLGLEFSFHKLARVGFPATIAGILEVVLMTALGIGFGAIMGWSFNNSLFLGAAISISSTTIIIKAIEELNLLKKRFTGLIFGILIIEDLLAILLLAVLSTVAVTNDIFSLNMIRVMGKLILVIGGWFIVGYFLIPSFHRKIMPFASEESVTIVSVSLCLAMVTLAAYLNYSISLGAFIMGSILAETPSIHKIRALIKPIRDIFAAVFFIATGMLMNPLIVIEQWSIILMITLITVIGKLVSASLATFLTGQNLNTSLRVGCAATQIGEFSFIIIGLGLSLNVVDEKLYPIIVAVSVITTFSTPYLIRSSDYVVKVLDNKLSNRSKLFLESYSATVFRGLSKISQGNYKIFETRLIINGLIVAILFTLSYQFIFPLSQRVIEETWIAKAVCWLISLLASSPFVWGMIFSYKRSNKTPFKNNLKTFVGFLATLLEITLFTFIYFQIWPILIFLLFVMTTFFVITCNKLEKIYRWFEHHLTNNMNTTGKAQKYEELAPWDTCLAEVKVGNQGEFINRPLKGSRIRETLGVNIIAIQRDHKIIFPPTGNEILLPNDKLVILGEEEQTDIFRKKMEKQSTEEDPIESLTNIHLKTLILNSYSELIGKTIRESKIREHTHAIIVGLERNGTRILNPDPNTRLQINDTLFLAGDVRYLKTKHIYS